MLIIPMTHKDAQKELTHALEYALAPSKTALPPKAHITAAAAVFRSAAAKLHRIGIMECNGVIGPDGHAKWDETDQVRADKETGRAMRRANRAIESVLGAYTHKVRVVHQPDPRGPNLQIYRATDSDSAQPIAQFWAEDR